MCNHYILVRTYHTYYNMYMNIQMIHYIVYQLDRNCDVLS